jgi:hypothetical protein
LLIIARQPFSGLAIDFQLDLSHGLCGWICVWNSVIDLTDTVPSVIIGTETTFLLFWLCTAAHHFQVKVQNLSFNFRVFSSISGEPFRNYSTLCTSGLFFGTKTTGTNSLVYWSSQNFSIWSHIPSTQWYQACDSTCLWLYSTSNLLAVFKYKVLEYRAKTT